MDTRKKGRKDVSLAVVVSDSRNRWHTSTTVDVPFDSFVESLILDVGDEVEGGSSRVTGWEKEPLFHDRGERVEQIALDSLQRSDGNRYEGVSCKVVLGGSIPWKACVVYPRGLMLCQVEEEVFLAIRVDGAWRELSLPDGWSIKREDGAVVWEEKRLAIPPYDGELYPWPVVFPKRSNMVLRLVRIFLPSGSNPLSGLLRVNGSAERTLAVQLRDELEVIKTDALRELREFVEDSFARGLTEADLR